MATCCRAVTRRQEHGCVCMVCLLAIGLLMKGRRRTQYTSKNGKRKANNEKNRVHKSSSLCFCVLCLLSFLTVDAVDRDLMTLSGEPSQHDLVTFAF